MTTFTPPVGSGTAWGDPESREPAERLMSFFGNVPTGETVWQDQDDVWHQGQYPSWGNQIYTTHDDGNPSVTSSPTPGIGNAKHVFQGGHTYDIDNLTALELIVAGYGSGINTSDVVGTFKTEDLAKFGTRMTMTSVVGCASGNPFIHGNDAWALQLATGTGAGTTNLREFFLHSDTNGWTNCHFMALMDPLLYAVDVDGDPNLDIIPQSGLVLRAQFNSGTGKNQGITLNNGTFLGLPSLNIGAWHAFPDGTGFANRQFSWPFGEYPGLPYGFEGYLDNNIIRVRIFEKGQDPNTVPWDHPTRARVLDLDVDCGSTATVPTPVGAGLGCGIISAHLGTDPRSMNRIRKLLLERRP